MARPSVREQIVDAAFEQFHLNGYNACGVKLVTDTAGVPKGSFYNHFASKEALALEVLERYAASRGMEALAEDDTPPLARLRGHFEFLAAEAAHFGYARGCVFGNFTTEAADHSAPIADGVRSGFATWTRAVAALLREARTDGSLPAHHDPDVLALFVVNAWEGAVVGARAAKDGSSFTAFFRVVFDSVLA
ncbi:TetR family transcriptional regulator C-terminal domain-containing protein [Umezawaea endophytica]|uniref:TetR/AcrR family transcriptional regulator n=1 Tax=Umezawaea endophytica TaxID=1654476 RepID=A0A9X2VGY2_9PSEU|nr:TetR/AcrR family transcriptional regulator [Umezawaea endophytica]MCS7475944.1 TetR/AcrR family transcriptional regulator [Umezawaea endophytica]